MKHAKGEWIVNGTIIQDENGYPIAQVWPNTKIPSAKSISLMKANACLIAKAPKLLAALINLLSACENEPFETHILEPAKEKARALTS